MGSVQTPHTMASYAIQIAFLAHLSTETHALDNGMMLLPPMGWNTWCAFGPCGTDVCTEKQVLDSIAAMKSNGMADVGYDWITLDDCYAMRRDANSELYPDPMLFPNGFAKVVAAAHAAGFKFGLYTSAGDYTCAAKRENCSGTCNVGSLGHYRRDAATPGSLCPTQTFEEYRTEVTLWAMASAPLLVSSDIRVLDKTQRELLLNADVLGIDQRSATSGELALTT